MTQFQKGTSRDASKHGRNAGTAVFVQKGTTLKVMEKFNIQGKQTSFYKYCPGTFGYILVFCIRQILGKKWEYNEAVHQPFIDFKKAYDSVRRELLYNIFTELGIPMKRVRLIKMCLNETYSRTRVGKDLSDMFPIRNGLK